MKRPDHEPPEATLLERFGLDVLGLAAALAAGVAIYQFLGPAWTWLYGAGVLAVVWWTLGQNRE